MFTPVDYSGFSFPTVDVVEAFDSDTSHARNKPLACSWIPDNVPVTKENLLAALEVTEEEREKIWSLGQREEGWHVARRGRLSGSRIGSACGMNKYCTQQRLVKEWLYEPVVDNANMAWGRDHEDEARQFYIDTMMYKNTPNKVMVEFAPSPSYVPDEYKNVEVVPVDPNEVSDLPYSIRVDVRGLVVSTVKSYCAYSSDGEVFETDDKGLLEIKCPRRLYDEIPPAYMAQIQYGMWLLDLKWADFLVWTPRGSTLVRYAYNEPFFKEQILRKAEDWYENQFLPEAIVAIEKERAWREENAQ